MYLVPGGVPGPGVPGPGECTWSGGVSVPGPRGCTWSGGTWSQGGVPGPQ